MGSSRFPCSPEALGSVHRSWDCPLCVVWEGTSRPGVTHGFRLSSRTALPRGSRSPVTAGRGGVRLERADGCGDLRGMVRKGIGEGTFPQATAEQGLQDTAGLDMWAEGSTLQRAA